MDCLARRGGRLLRVLVPVVVGLGGGAAGAGPIQVLQPVVDQPSAQFWSGFRQDKIVGDYLFSSYGLGAFGSGGPFDTGQKFLGLSFNPSSVPIGGITGGCATDWGPCAYFGAKATLGGHGKFGTEFQARAGGGALDVRVPMRATLDLPYNAAGGDIPTLGSGFTIGSSWVSNVKSLSQPGTVVKSVTPLLATHGPWVQAYADLIGELGASISGKICVVDCWSDGISPSLGGRWELASVNRNGDNKFRVLDAEVTPKGKALGGIINYELRLPKLDAKDDTLAPSGLGGKLQTAAQDRVATVALDIDEAVSKLTGVPLTGEVGFKAFGEFIGANYALVDASAGFDTLLKQRVSVQTLPIVRLDFASPVRASVGAGNWSAPTQSVTFNLGESVTLRNDQASLLGGEASFGMMLAVSTELELEVQAKISVEALKAGTTLGGLGPLFGPESASFPVATIPLYQTNYATSVQELGGMYFNMMFQPAEGPLSPDSQIAALGVYDAVHWKDSSGNSLCAEPSVSTTPDCLALAQPKFTGFFDLGPLPPCLFDPDGCVPGELEERLQLAIAEGPLAGQWRSGALRLLDVDGQETFLNTLAALDDPLLDIGPGLSDEQFASEVAAMFADVGSSRLALPPLRDISEMSLVLAGPATPPPWPTPAPGTAALLGLGLAALAIRRRLRCFTD